MTQSRTDIWFEHVVLSLKIRIAKTFYLACAYALFMNPCRRELFKTYIYATSQSFWKIHEFQFFPQ